VGILALQRGEDVKLVMAAFGVVAVYVILKKLYENEYGIKL
jgi:hypothetical protein